MPPNTAITATVRLTSLDPATYSSVLFRADLTVFGHGETRCDGDDTGKDVEVPVQASREVFTISVYDACPHSTYGNYTLKATIFDAGYRTELASATAYFMMSFLLTPGESSFDPPAAGVAAWLDPAPPPVMYVGQWYPLRVRADLRLFRGDHVSVWGSGSEPYLLTSVAGTTPTNSVEEACLNPHSDVVQWRRAIHQKMHVAACMPGTAEIKVLHDTESVAPLYTYQIEIRRRP